MSKPEVSHQKAWMSLNRGGDEMLETREAAETAQSRSSHDLCDRRAPHHFSLLWCSGVCSLWYFHSALKFTFNKSLHLFPSSNQNIHVLVFCCYDLKKSTGGFIRDLKKSARTYKTI